MNLSIRIKLYPGRREMNQNTAFINRYRSVNPQALCIRVLTVYILSKQSSFHTLKKPTPLLLCTVETVPRWRERLLPETDSCAERLLPLPPRVRAVTCLLHRGRAQATCVEPFIYTVYGRAARATYHNTFTFTMIYDQRWKKHSDDLHFLI